MLPAMESYGVHLVVAAEPDPTQDAPVDVDGAQRWRPARAGEDPWQRFSAEAVMPNATLAGVPAEELLAAASRVAASCCTDVLKSLLWVPAPGLRGRGLRDVSLHFTGRYLRFRLELELLAFIEVDNGEWKLVLQLRQHRQQDPRLRLQLLSAGLPLLDFSCSAGPKDVQVAQVAKGPFASQLRWLVETQPRFQGTLRLAGPHPDSHIQFEAALWCWTRPVRSVLPAQVAEAPVARLPTGLHPRAVSWGADVLEIEPDEVGASLPDDAH